MVIGEVAATAAVSTGIIELPQQFVDLGFWKTLGLIALLAIVQDDLTCIGVGVLISAGKLSWPIGLSGCFLGTVAGDFAWLLLARFAGRPILLLPPVSWVVGTDGLAYASRSFDRWGGWALVFSRFLPFSRTAIQVFAGLFYRSIPKATGLLFFSGALYTALLVGLCYWIGDQVDATSYYRTYGVIAQIGLVALLFAALIGLRRVRNRF